jgi:hypothetical protein
MPEVKALQEELAQRRQLLHTVQVMQMKPGYTAVHLELLANLERWLRTSVKTTREEMETAKSCPT